jgi:DNA-binding MarR family transcriptional regulator
MGRSALGTFRDESTAGERVLVGLSRIGTVLRSQAWEGSAGTGIHPTQAQVLVFLARSGPPGLRLSELADRLAINRSTTSESVSALERKGLVERRPDPSDGRAIRIALTPDGEVAAAGLGEWPDLLLEVVGELDPGEKGALLRLLTKLIRGLQLRGEITPQRMCVSCRFFQPDVHDDPERPHHCGYVDAPFGDAQLRLDCREHEPAEAAATATWETFSGR